MIDWLQMKPVPTADSRSPQKDDFGYQVDGTAELCSQFSVIPTKKYLQNIRKFCKTREHTATHHLPDLPEVLLLGVCAGIDRLERLVGIPGEIDLPRCRPRAVSSPVEGVNVAQLLSSPRTDAEV